MQLEENVSQEWESIISLMKERVKKLRNFGIQKEIEEEGENELWQRN